MATDLRIPYVTQALTANGGANGILAVTSTANFRKGAKVLLKSSGVDAIELVVDKVIDGTTLAVRDPSKTGTFRFDASSYTLAENAAVTQNAQEDFYASQWLRY